MELTGRDSEDAIFHEVGPLFEMPKFPIERQEMNTHIFARQRSRYVVKEYSSSEDVHFAY